jgi:tetratricopeptide (TPR) repeat protein
MTIFATGGQADAQAMQAMQAASSGIGTAGKASEQRYSLRIPILVLTVALSLTVVVWRSKDIERAIISNQTACLDLKDSGPDRAVEACVAAIASERYAGQALATLHRAQGLAHAERGEHKATVTALSQALAIDDSDKLAYFLRARAQHALRNWAPALADYGRAIKLDADYAEAYARRGMLRFDTRQYEKAIADLTLAIDKQPTAAAHFFRGQAYLVMRDYIAAFTDFDRAVALEPERGAHYRMRGVAHEFLGRRVQAVADYRTALMKDETDREARDRLARLGAKP